MRRKVCHNCPDRTEAGACRKTCERWIEEQRLWDEEMQKRIAINKGKYFSLNAKACITKKLKGH